MQNPILCVQAVVSHYEALSNNMEGCRGKTFATYA